MERAEAEAIYEQGKDVVVAVLLRMDEQIQRLERRVAAQGERIAQLERRVKRSSRNSSQPPSERFWRGAAAKGIAGRGIGLSVVASLARAHGGDVTVDSVPGRGARFTVTLPFATTATPPVPPSAETNQRRGSDPRSTGRPARTHAGHPPETSAAPWRPAHARYTRSAASFITSGSPGRS